MNLPQTRLRETNNPSPQTPIAVLISKSYTRFVAKPTILCVDDEIDNVDALERLFRGNYTVLKATSGVQALGLLDQHPEPIALIITDQRMPEMTGVEFLEKSLAKHPDAIRILLTGYTDVQSVVAAINSGQIYRYLTKPWDPVDLINTVHRAVERFQMSSEIKDKTRALEKAYEELKSLDSAKNQFMILVNHELKTPLTSILSFSELLQETRMTEEQELCLRRIYRGAMRLKHLIDDVLVVISAETKVLKVKSTSFELSQLNLSYPEESAQTFQQKNLSFNLAPFPNKIVGDPEMISTVFRKIMHNAVKFAKPDTEISVTSEITSPHRVRISIRNSGPPIPVSVIDKVLQPFYIDENVMNHSTGMGLGLTVCHSILKAHSSQLQIQNVSEGVSVSFELPCL